LISLKLGVEQWLLRLGRVGRGWDGWRLVNEY
jgi:hypothetical protein